MDRMIYFFWKTFVKAFGVISVLIHLWMWQLPEPFMAFYTLLCLFSNFSPVDSHK